MADIAELVNNMLYMVSEKPDMLVNLVSGLVSGLDPKAVVGLVNGTTAALGEHPEVRSDILSLLSGIRSEMDIQVLPMMLGLLGPMLDMSTPMIERLLDMIEPLLERVGPLIGSLTSALEPIMGAITPLIDYLVKRLAG